LNGKQTTGANAMTTIKIENVTYEIVKAETADDMDSRNLHNIARMMRENKIEKQLLLKRPNGKILYFSNQFAPSKYGTGYSRPFAL
jgi:hypothetical protein